MTAPIVDPGLAAFWAADPGVLDVPDPLAPPPPDEETEHRSHLALAISAAFMVCAWMARKRLASQLDRGDPYSAAMGAWGSVSTIWLHLAGAAIRKSLLAGPLRGTADPATLGRIADTYAAGVGAYLSSSSAEAFAVGLNRQLADRWSEQAAWVRASAGFGIDKQAYSSYLAGAQEGTELVTPAAQALADDALLSRAETIGDSESHSLGETAKALVWLQLQNDGELPAGTRRVWLTDHDESTCPTCGPLNHRLAELDEPFTTASGEKLWAPQAHPNCRCRIELRHPVIKAYDPHEPRSSDGRWRYAPAYQPVLDRPPDPAETTEEEAEAAKPTPSVWEQAAQPATFSTQSPLAAAAGPSSLLAARQGSSLLAGPSLLAQAKTAGPFARRGRRKIKRTSHHLIMPPPQPLPPQENEPYYLAVDAFHQLASKEMGSQYSQFDGEPFVNFDDAKPMLAHATNLNAVKDPTPWAALIDDFAFYDRAPHDVDRSDILDAWQMVVPKAKKVWDLAINDADRVVGRLEMRHIDQIEAMAGRASSLPPDQAKLRILEATRKLGDGDDSLAAAYADYVTWLHPDWVGHDGDLLSEAIQEQSERANIYIGGLEPGDITDQVFVFANGFQPNTRLDNYVAHPVGRFVMLGQRYRSALQDFPRPGDVPPMRYGLIEAYMQPYIERHEPPPWDEEPPPAEDEPPRPSRPRKPGPWQGKRPL